MRLIGVTTRSKDAGGHMPQKVQRGDGRCFGLHRLYDTRFGVVEVLEIGRSLRVVPGIDLFTYLDPETMSVFPSRQKT